MMNTNIFSFKSQRRAFSLNLTYSTRIVADHKTIRPQDRKTMEYFLERIARELYSEHGNNLSSHCLVFPNRRAGLFFMKYLAAEIEKPVWTPAIMTINDLFRSLSALQPAENEILLFELYKVYRKIRKSGESFDDFYFWGDMLLNDFDDIDKYLVDASKIIS